MVLSSDNHGDEELDWCVDVAVSSVYDGLLALVR